LFTVAEIASALARRHREGSIRASERARWFGTFWVDCARAYLLLWVEEDVSQRAVGLVNHYPLRTADAIQLSTALTPGRRAADRVAAASMVKHRGQGAKQGGTRTDMHRLMLGILLGMAFGVIDVVMTLFGQHPDRTTAMLLQAFFSRFAIGVLGANVSLPMHPALAGALVGLLISLPDAFALHSYVGILGTGLIFGALAGWAAKAWAA